MTETTVYGSHSAREPKDRSRYTSVKRGFLGRCPNCGEGKLFISYSKPVDACAVCNEDMTHQRADDFPAYLCIFIVGHTMIPLMIAMYTWTDINMWVQMAFFLPFLILFSLWLLPKVKGAVIGLQWALRMHGFANHDDEKFELK